MSKKPSQRELNIKDVDRLLGRRGSSWITVAAVSAALILLFLATSGPAHAHAAPPVIGGLVDVQQHHVMGTLPQEAVDGYAAGVVGAIQRPPQRAERSGRLRGVVLPASEREYQLVQLALDHCDNARGDRLDVWLALRLLRLEEDAGLPASMRGVTLAAWCGETSYSSGYGDDCKRWGCDGAEAVGILQMHAGAMWDWCGRPDRRDPEGAASCWLARIRYLSTGNREAGNYNRGRAKRCGSDAWRAAELWVSAGPAPRRLARESNDGYAARRKAQSYPCGRVSGHVARLSYWQKIERFRLRQASR